MYVVAKCCFSYSIQGSGKTFTMMGSHDQNQTGLIPRLCDELFDRISKVNIEKFNHLCYFITCIYLVLMLCYLHVTFQNDDENITYKVEVSYIEIYNEKVRDLLCPRGYVTNIYFQVFLKFCMQNIIMLSTLSPSSA